MTTVRVLPLATAPVPGEALDSWLQATAVRHGIALKDLYQHLGLDMTRDLRKAVSTIAGTDDTAQRISAATGASPAQVHAMTLVRYLPAVTLRPDATPTFTAITPRHHGDGWRFCPHCLAASGGAWLLRWRLLWSFACLQHHCLLAERCPRCGRRQRARLLADAVPPRPVHCAYPDATTTGQRRRPRCDADLATTPVIDLPPDHPALRAQGILDNLLNSKQGLFGLYAAHPTAVPVVLGDIRLLGRGIFSATKGAYLDDLLLPADLATLYRKQLQNNSFAGATGGIAASVIESAAAATAAITLLNQSDLQSAAAPLAALPDEVSRYVLHEQERIGRVDGPTPSPVLQGLHYTALGDRLTPVQQLNYRLDSPFPRKHPTNVERQRRLLRRLPAALWPDWALRLTPPTLGLASARAVLAAAVLLVGSDLDIADAAALLSIPLTHRQAVYRLWRFKESPCWPEIRAAVGMLADYLDTHDSPIDYQQRRSLNYGALLPQVDWNAICRQAGRPARPAAHTRAYLQHRICGTAAPRRGAPRTNAALGQFPHRLTPHLLEVLDDYALRFLHQQGIRDEPVVWAPPLSLLRHRTLPGGSDTDIDLGELHRLIRDQQCSIPAASQRLGVNANLVRAVLEHHPAPAKPRPAWTPRPGALRPGTVYQDAARALPRDRLIDLYTAQQRSLADIEAATGFGRKTIARLARDYGIPLRRPGGRATPPVDGDWLYTEYVLKKRSCAELARELHIRAATVVRLVEPYRSPLRTVRRRTESQVRANPNVPDLLVPALVGHGGWERLQRFAIIAQFSTLTDAGHHLGINVAATGSCISRLEKDFRARLLVHGPLRCTAFGEEVLVAVAQLAEWGGP
ncbi:TniQ family protein [Mycolicibacterium austroafricanum]|uniref:TniQ family protein n=1 Tax=Mycolicibacterium austroafricanum TaxID=39687 RepID=UPI00055E04C6|nr:TniQ family protein [Mycolicibacterium austroafricanum]QZY47028.1 TniQ family protein [Mycolicibacterium austroafricanum]